MLSKILQREKEISLRDINTFVNSREFSQITLESSTEKKTYDILEAFFNGYAFTFILNIDRNAHDEVKDIVFLVKDKSRENKLKHSKRCFFAVTVPRFFSASDEDARIEISLIKESFDWIVGYRDIYYCRLYGSYPYSQKVFCENLIDLPLVFRKFIEENQDKPEKLLEFFLNFKLD